MSVDYETTGGPAFPWQENGVGDLHPGMSLRAYLAAKAMQGFYACEEPVFTDIAKAASYIGVTPDEYKCDIMGHYAKCIAKMSVTASDALLAELAKAPQ